MKLDSLLALDDFEGAALNFLPRPIFGYIESGVETQSSRHANRDSFQSYQFVTRVLRDVSARSSETTLLGKTYSAPFGIAPMGIMAIAAYRGDVVLAAAAKIARIPMVVSGASLIPMETISQTNADAWFQAYLFGDNDSISQMLDRCLRAGFGTLVVTVDAPGNANRENFVRVGFSTPLRPSLRLAMDGLLRPRWLFSVFARTLLNGMPHFENSSATRGAPIISSKAARQFSGRSRFSWQHIEFIRKNWAGHLMVKGILSPRDALMARDLGVDAIIVSNHGGRQLDGAIPAMLMLEEIVNSVGGYPVVVDGGFRRGSDVLKALALGARFILIGRPFAYAAAIGGVAGVTRAIQLLSQEVDRNLAMIGVTSLEQLDRTYIRRADGSPIPSPNGPVA